MPGSAENAVGGATVSTVPDDDVHHPVLQDRRDDLPGADTVLDRQEGDDLVPGTA